MPWWCGVGGQQSPPLLTRFTCGIALVFEYDTDRLARKLLPQYIHVFAMIKADEVIRIFRILRFLVTMHSKDFEESHALE